MVSALQLPLAGIIALHGSEPPIMGRSISRGRCNIYTDTFDLKTSLILYRSISLFG